ncbi:MAG: exonuclease domain-containing protein [Kyrpidia sp.]|nr:exonuclease domain-containing protein [Kyrpidia sp.]
MKPQRLGWFQRLLKNRDVTALLAASTEGSAPAEAALRSMVREINRRDIWEESLDRLKYVVFDTETTGFDWRSDALIEIGAVHVEGREVNEERSFSSLIALEPGRSLPEPVRRITGLTEEELRGAPNVGEVLSKFMVFCGDGVLVAHHAQHDVNFLNVSLSKLYGIQLPLRVVDTARVARKLWPDSGEATLDYLIERMDIPPLNRHRALNDALLTARIWSVFLGVCMRKGITRWGEFFTWLKSDAV